MAPSKEDDRPRQKKWATKVRTGCLTCRSRRIKCDEEKPACRKCASTGRFCEGYPVKKSTKGITTPKALVALVPRASPEIIVPNVRELAYSNGPPGVNTTPEGRFIMHFFRREACPNIGGAIDKRFWSVDLQQATDTHPIMWYSSAAFAALYLRRNEKRYSSFKVATGDFLDTFALSQYNHAIRCAIQMASQPHLLSIDQKQAFLMSSLIFTGIGYLNGNTDEALTHLRNGLRLFSMWKFDKQLHENIGSQSLLSAKSLIMLFRRFTTQSLHLRDESWPETKWTEESMDDSNDNFTTPTDAYFAIEPIYNRLVTFLGEKRRPSSSNSEPQPIRDAAYDVRTDFDAWKLRFANLHHSKDLEPIDQEGVLILRIREAVIEAALTVNMTEYNIALDTIDVHFRTILKDADDLLELQLNSWRTGETFTFSASVCEALSFIGTSCRDAELRERAVELLRKWPLMDGAYDAGLLARVSAAYGDAYGRIEGADTDDSQLGSDDSGHAIAWIQPHSQKRPYRMHSQLPTRHWLTGFDKEDRRQWGTASPE